MTISRRTFLAASSAASSMSLAFLAMQRAVAGQAQAAPTALARTSGPLALPPGFSQTVFSRTGEAMNDGLVVPGKHDGMCALAVPGDRSGRKVLLIRNHEIEPAMGTKLGAFGEHMELIDRIDRSKLYDNGFGKTPILGGTTTLLYDLDKQAVERQFLSLGGTGDNCAGGHSPWGSWISCEEFVPRADGKEYERDHGYCFEVPGNIESGLVHAKPLTALGRFKHEAVAFDAARGILYLTEDQGDAVLYRFLPSRAGDLTSGRLQALVVADRRTADGRGFDGRNWPPMDKDGKPTGPAVVTVFAGERFPVKWIDVDDVESPNNDLRLRMFDKGAMRFARCEGIWHTGDAMFVAATTGGPKSLGQLWRYHPSAHEGGDRESESPATIELFVESHDRTVLKNCDNLCAAPWGELFVCEDGAGSDGLVRVKPDGTVRRFCVNVLNDSELAGVCFSPDGSTLFVNVQDPGMTVAITGPWDRG